MKKKVFVAMSGGVDSSVAAALLKQKGYEVIGAHMRCFNVDGCAEQDAEDARRAAEALGIPFYVFDFEKEYKNKVVNYMIDGYRKGITPNPDVMCNKEIKFGLFFQKARELGADFIATGHYVRKIGNRLAIAKDLNKDQSYFLWTLKPAQIKKSLFPVGEYKKSQVRKLAKKFELLNAEKKDSQGICFLGQVKLGDFLKQYIPAKRGIVLTTAGEKVGEHNGAYFYTIGQRQGLGIGGYEKPLYVAEKNVRKNELVVAEGDDHPALHRKEIELSDVNFISPQHSNILQNVGMLPVMARVRYRQPLAKATLYSGFRLVFNKPQKFVAAGQSAVIYDAKGRMLGGGVIR